MEKIATIASRRSGSDEGKKCRGATQRNFIGQGRSLRNTRKQGKNVKGGDNGGK